MVTTFPDAGSAVDLPSAAGGFTHQSRVAISVAALVQAVSVPTHSRPNLHPLANVHGVRRS